MNIKELLLQALAEYLELFPSQNQAIVSEIEKEFLCDEKWNSIDGYLLTDLLKGILEKLGVKEFSEQYWQSPIVHAFFVHFIKDDQLIAKCPDAFVVGRIQEASEKMGMPKFLEIQRNCLKAAKKDSESAKKLEFLLSIVDGLNHDLAATEKTTHAPLLHFGPSGLPLIGPQPTYSTEEHEIIGRNVTLYDHRYEVISQPLPVYAYDADKKIPVRRPHEELTYGEMVALAGDYYGAETPISDKKDQEARKLFVAHYNDMAKDGVQKEKIKIFDIASAHHSAYYETLLYIWHLGWHYKTLLANNFDHFYPDSWIAYEAGHAEALAMALKSHELRVAGKNEESQQYLYLAYSMNAFACHFLSDNFAGGHVEVPRRALAEVFGKTKCGKKVHDMHDDDGDHGVIVEGPLADGTRGKWTLYGDGCYPKSENEKNRYALGLVMQASADEIYEVLAHGKNGMPKGESKVKECLPKPVKPEDDPKQRYPLYRVRDGKLEARKSSSDRRCSKYKVIGKVDAREHYLASSPCLFIGKTVTSRPFVTDKKLMDDGYQLHAPAGLVR